MLSYLKARKDSFFDKLMVKKLNEIFTPRERRQIVFLFIASLVSAFAQTFGVAAVFPFINVVMNPEVITQNRLLQTLYQLWNFESVSEFTIILGISVIIIVVFSNLLSAGTMWATTRFAMYKNHTLSKRLLTVYLSKPYKYFLQKNSNELGKNILAEINQLTNLFLMAIFGMLINGSLLVLLLIMLLFVNVVATVGAIVFLGGSYGLLNMLIKKKMKKSGRSRLNANEERFRLANEALSSIKTTKVMGNELFFIENYGKQSKKFAQYNIFANIAGELPRFILEALTFGGIVFYIVLELIRGNQLSEMIPMVSLYAFAGYRIMPALHHFYNYLMQLYYNQAILDKIYQDMIQEVSEEDYLLISEVLNEQPQNNSKILFKEKIQLKDVAFRYSDASENVIDHFNLSILKNTTIGIVGTTGSGKTTLADIIVGLLSPDEGQFMIDDVEINRENMRCWQQLIGYVPQDIYLTDDTIKNNIAFGVPETEINDEQLKTAVQIASLEEFIVKQLPQQYNTRIGDRGVRLSGGQRQRIGLARALYRNPDILILDEATSSLDGTTEEEVLQAINHASKVCTVVMIAHRLNTLKNCDQIYIVDKGKICSQGTYDELIKSNDIFMRMAKI